MQYESGWHDQKDGLGKRIEVLNAEIKSVLSGWTTAV